MRKWIVYDKDEREVFITSDYEKALKLYEKYKKDCEDYVIDSGEFLEDEGIILAKIEKSFYSDFSKEDENGVEKYEFKEEINKDIEEIRHYISGEIYKNKNKDNIDISEYCRALEKVDSMLYNLNK